jgi:hypothetical protein
LLWERATLAVGTGDACCGVFLNHAGRGNNRGVGFLFSPWGFYIFPLGHLYFPLGAFADALQAFVKFVISADRLLFVVPLPSNSKVTDSRLSHFQN